MTEGLARRVGALRQQGHDADALGDPDDLAARMLATVPEPSPWDELGPFYSTAGLARVLGGVSRQAIEERRRRRTVLALRTADDAWVYPRSSSTSTTASCGAWPTSSTASTPRPRRRLDDRLVPGRSPARARRRQRGRAPAGRGDLVPVLALADERADRWSLAT